MDSTLLPTAARLRQSRQEDVGGIFSSQSAMMLCGHPGALQVGPPPAARPPHRARGLEPKAITLGLQETGASVQPMRTTTQTSPQQKC